MARQKVTYNEGSIVVKEGLDGVRSSATMYLGELGPMMLKRCVKEVVDNARDEYRAERNSSVEVCIDTKTHQYIVADSGEGIPVGLNKETKLSTLTVVFTKLHAGGKDAGGAYKDASGTHGIGVAAVNAVCDSLVVYTNRDKKWWSQSFAKGKPTSKVVPVTRLPVAVTKCLTEKYVRGTIVVFTPDFSVVSDDKAGKACKPDVKDMRVWLDNVALLNKGLSVTYTIDGKTTKRINKIGLGLFISNRIKSLEVETIGKPIYIEEDKLQLALQWSSYEESDGLQSFVSASPTVDHGTHVNGLMKALVASISKYKGARDKFVADDIKYGLVGAFNFNMIKPAFTSQIKNKLSSPVAAIVEEIVQAPLDAFFAKNKSLAKQIIKRAAAAKAAREEFKKVMRGATKVKNQTKGALLPTILYSSPRATPETREIYLVEGDSAAGTAKNARDPLFQEVLKIQGKILNVWRAKPAQIWANESVRNIMAAMGYNPKAENPCEKLRVKRVFLLSDADEDGKHINLLLLGVFWKFMPVLFEQGRIFICNAGLFNAFYKNRRYFGDNFDECAAKMPKGAPHNIIQRAKGWGEVNAETLADAAFNTSTRRITQVSPLVGKKELDYFIGLVGADTALRKQLLGV